MKRPTRSDARQVSPDSARQMLGLFLKQARERRGLTQLDVASHLGYTSAQFVSNWERGVSIPPRRILPTLASYLGIKAGDMIAAVGDYDMALVVAAKLEIERLFRSSRNQVAR